MARYKSVNGVQVQFTAQEEAARDTEEAAWTTGAFDRAIARLRDDRNILLAKTDFYALSDVTMSEAMTTYRQELRDLPSGLSTVEDVENVTYPTKP
tara:strand:+ start:477 stop:764 length:288 start_codon:yes stop_codon:yes gene_type:complete